jgi:hypothetical protein
MAIMRDGELVETWTVGSIKLSRYDLSEDQCREVLEELARRYNAHVGITWDVIAAQAERLFPVGGVREKKLSTVMH